MTCIVGMVTSTSIFVGGDSLASMNGDGCLRADSKVFVRDKFIYGFCGSFRANQILKYSFSEPDHDPRVSVEEYLNTVWVDEFRGLLADKNCATVDSNEMTVDAWFVVGYGGRLFVVEPDFQVSEPLLPYCAIGSGSKYALGSMNALYRDPIRFSPSDMVRFSLEASAEFCCTVAGPFNVLELRHDD